MNQRFAWSVSDVEELEQVEKSEPYIVEPISKAESDILLNIAENGAHLDDVFWEQFKVEINRLVQRGYAYFTDTSGGGPGYANRTVTLTQKGIDALAMWRRETGGRLQSLVAMIKHLPMKHDQETHGRELYHGTSTVAAKSILKQGLLVSKTRKDRTPGKKGVYATGKLKTAIEFGQLRAAQEKKDTYGVVVLTGKPDAYNTEWDYAHFNGDIPVSQILRVEIRSAKDGKVISVLKSAAGGEMYVPVLFNGDDYEVLDVE